MNWRMFGCGTLAAAAFVLIGVVGIWRSAAPAECPNVLPYEPASYRPVGSPGPSPSLEGITDTLERAGTTSFGLASWDVYVEPGRAPTASGELLPQRIVLGCGDGTFRAYQRGTE